MNVFSRVFPKELLDTLAEDFRLKKTVRIYVGVEDLSRILSLLDIVFDRELVDDYEYVLVLEPVNTS